MNEVAQALLPVARGNASAQARVPVPSGIRANKSPRAVVVQFEKCFWG